MSSENKAGIFFLTLFFGGSVAALGVHELSKGYQQSSFSGGKGSASALVGDLTGENQYSRAAQIQKSGKGGDKVSRSDREALRSLIDKVVDTDTDGEK